ncbi:Uncharacterised protein [Vibrio cholerae]|nr:Uncharacterised protein [Vibrio cholerae]
MSRLTFSSSNQVSRRSIFCAVRSPGWLRPKWSATSA